MSSKAALVNGQRPGVLRFEGWLGPHVLDLIDGETVMVADLPVDPVRISAVEDQLLDDLALLYLLVPPA